MDFSSIGYTNFISFLKKPTKKRWNDVYLRFYKESLVDGLKILKNDGNCKAFVESTHANDGRISVHSDRYNKPLFD